MLVLSWGIFELKSVESEYNPLNSLDRIFIKHPTKASDTQLLGFPQPEGVDI